MLEQELLALGVKPSSLAELGGPLATERSSMASDFAASRRRGEGSSSPVDDFKVDSERSGRLEDVGPSGDPPEGRATSAKLVAPPSTPQVGGSQFSEEGHGLDNLPADSRPEDLKPSDRTDD